jgi:hypothetical protein
MGQGDGFSDKKYQKNRRLNMKNFIHAFAVVGMCCTIYIFCFFIYNKEIM